MYFLVLLVLNVCVLCGRQSLHKAQHTGFLLQIKSYDLLAAAWSAELTSAPRAPERVSRQCLLRRGSWGWALSGPVFDIPVLNQRTPFRPLHPGLSS